MYNVGLLDNGRYDSGTQGYVRSCPHGYDLYASRYVLDCDEGCWNEPIEKYRCIPGQQGKLDLSVEFEFRFNLP